MNAKRGMTNRKGLAADEVTVGQAAQRLGVRRGRVYEWIDRGVFPTVRNDSTSPPMRLKSDEVEQLRYFGAVRGGEPVRRRRRK